MDKFPPSCTCGLPGNCAFQVSFPPQHFSSCNSLSDLKSDCHDSGHPKSLQVRGKIKWPQHQSVFPVSILFGLQPLTFSYSIWLLYSGTQMNIAWPCPKDGDLYTVLLNFTHGLGTSPKPSGNSNQLFVFLPSSLLFDKPKRFTLGKRFLTSFTAHVSAYSLWFYPCSRHISESE